MSKWIRGIGVIAFFLLALEAIAWVGITLLGEDAFDRFKNFYFPKGATEAVTTEIDSQGTIEKCSTFDGQIFCIKESGENKGKPTQKPPPKTPINDPERANGNEKERCSTFEGELICIKENGTHKMENGSANSAVEKCSTFEGELICIKENQ